MNRNDEIELTEAGDTGEHGEYVVHRDHHRNMIALSICFVMAVLLWMIAMNAEDTRHCKLSLDATGTENYRYELSLDEVEVQGSVSALKELHTVHVNSPMLAMVGEGTYVVPAEYLVLPEGVRVVGDIELTITVIAK